MRTHPIQSLVGNPALYDLVQMAAGANEIRRRLQPYVRHLAGGRILDVGAGTGAYVETVPRPYEYVAVDLDPRKLQRLSTRYPAVEAVVADATDLPFPSRSFDHALVVFLAHHLDDDGLDAMLASLARILRGTLVLLDPLASHALQSKLLWRLDRGAHPRSPEALRAAVDRAFTIEDEDRFRIHHDYLLCVARPRAA